MALFLYVHWGHPEESLRGRLVESLTRVLGRPTGIDRVELDYLPPGVTVEGFRADGPLLAARRVEATFSLRALMSGRLVIKDLDLYDPVLRWEIDSQRLFAPRDTQERTEQDTFSRFSLRRFRIHGGELRLGSTRHSITAEMDGVSLQADNTSLGFGLPGLKGPWQGSLNFKQGRFAIDDLAIEGLAGSMSIDSDGDLLHAQRLRFKAEQVDIRGSAVVRAGSPPKGRIDLTMLLNPEARSISRPLHQFGARQVSADMRVELSGDGVRVSGGFIADQPSIDLDRLESSDGPERPWNARRCVGTYAVDARRIEVAGTLESFSGGTMKGRYIGLLEEKGAQREHDVELDASGLRLDDVLRHFDLPGDDSVDPSAGIAGHASVHWRGTDRESMTGSASLGFLPAPGELPVSGNAQISWKGRRVTIISSLLDTDGSRATVTGLVDATIRPSGAMGLKLAGTLDSTDSAPLTRFIERRFGRIPAQPGGRINATFDVAGTTQQPEVESRFRSSSLAVTLPRIGGASGSPGVPIELTAVSGRMAYRNDLVRLEVDEARGDGIDLALSLQADPRTGGLLGLVLNATQVPGSLLVRLAGLDPSRVRVEGEARVTTRLQTDPGAAHLSSSLRGDIEITADDALVNDIRLTRVKGQGRLEPGKLHIGEASFDLFGGAARAEGDIDLSAGGSRGVIGIEARAIDLAAIDARYAGPSMTGLLAASGKVTLGEPGSIEATLTGEGVTVAGIALGRLDGTLKGPLNRMMFELRDETGDLAATGALLPGNEGDPLDIDATVTARKQSLERIRPLLPPGALAGLKGDADGVVTVTGPLIEPSSLEIHARLDHVSLTAGDYTLHNQEAVHLTEENGFLTLAPTRLVGEKTDLGIGGTMALGGNHEVTARVEGSFDLGLIEILFPEMRASGPGTADIGVIQRGDTLTYTGTVSVDNGRITHPGLPLPLTNLKGHGEFTEQGQLRIDEIDFDMGGGKATGTGWARFEGASMPQLHLAMAGRGIRAEILPELRAFFDADVTLDKDYVAYQLAGRVTIQRAIYSRPFGVAPSELLLRSREYAPTHERRPGAPEVNLALDIVADGDLWVRNDDALIEASTQLSLEGTLDRPELSGRITALEGGTYRFRDVTYRIVGGSLDFVDVTRIDPLIDIEASTRVQQYEVTLRISGRFSKPIYELTADPTLPQRDIVWLLLTGHTLSESPGNEASRGFAEGQVASYLAAPVAGAVTGPLEKILGVSSVQIDPFFLNGTADPSARLTVTKRVAANLLFTYSSSLGQSGQEIYQMEYNPGRLWDFIATRDLDGSIGADVRIRRRWRGITPPPPLPAGAPSDTPTVETPAHLRVGRISITADHLVDSEHSLARKLPYDENDPFRRGDLLEGRETLREHYVAHG
ncbi:MAG TPA: translocation/assembly module TamB domain-containing protein, partial [Patescibacteria group bacterium]|nr:translocation/assembly module TamB domain-containing protein [Patescibacteria group bacterium]